VSDVIVWKVKEEQGQYDLEKLDATYETLDAASLNLPRGVYTTFRTYRKRYFLRLEDHFVRLDESARLLGFEIGIDWMRFRNLLRIAIKEERETRFRIHCTQEHTYLIAEALHTPSPIDYQQGVRVMIVHLQRQNPLAKQTSFIEQAADLRQKLPVGVHEALMVGEQGEILEGLSSNFFAVKNSCLYTAGAGVLQGVTQRVVMEIAQSKGVPLKTESVRVETLSDIDEAFITSASRGILPVRQVDDCWVGKEVPGPITKQLMAAYDAWIDHHVEPI